MKAHEAKEVLRADNELDQVKSLAQRTEKLYGEVEPVLLEAKRSKDLRTVLAAVRESVSVIREARANATLQRTDSAVQPAPMLRNQIDFRMLFAVPQLVSSHKVIRLDPQEFPEIDKEERSLYQEVQKENALLGATGVLVL